MKHTKTNMLQYRPMKENYFSFDTLDATVQNFQKALGQPSRPVKLQFAPDQAALLALDLQSYFLDPVSHAYIPSAEAILPRLQALLKCFYAHRRPVFFTQHINTPEDAGMMAVWWRDLITPDSPFVALDARLDTSQATILHKSQYDAFFQTRLAASLQEQDVKQVVIVGVMTHLCCETTARAAFMRGFQVFFPVDGTATYNRDFHLATLRNLAHGFAMLCTLPDLIAAMDAHHEN